MHEAHNDPLKQRAMRYRDMATLSKQQATAAHRDDVRDAYWGLALQWNVLANEVEAQLIF